MHICIYLSIYLYAYIYELNLPISRSHSLPMRPMFRLSSCLGDAAWVLETYSDKHAAAIYIHTHIPIYMHTYLNQISRSLSICRAQTFQRRGRRGVGAPDSHEEVPRRCRRVRYTPRRPWRRLRPLQTVGCLLGTYGRHSAPRAQRLRYTRECDDCAGDGTPILRSLLSAGGGGSSCGRLWCCS